ncbi:Uncharacterized protein TCM_025636 [Theobroma cacao]|uniref:CCHC-type domain-containing protein n=1 Tax=Theobroma cacao TaxID=3641 RepID=A0A061F040_THECC|nr:Uncharacterized protein TCM_025636 [Theobroma cacao]
MKADSSGESQWHVGEDNTVKETGVGTKRSCPVLDSIVASKPPSTTGDVEDFEEEGEIVEESDSDHDINETVLGGPHIRLTKEEKRRIRRLWRNTLIVKLLGREISYTYLCNRVKQLWSLGPWIIADHYLTIRRWSPDFCSEDASIDSVSAWIRLSGRWQRIEYQGLRLLCFHCGEFGHNVENCPVKKKEAEGFTEDEALNLSKLDKILEKDYESSKYGPWMHAKKSYRRSVASRMDGGQKSKFKTDNHERSYKCAPCSGSRFFVLEEDNNDQDDVEIVPNTMEQKSFAPIVPNTKNTVMGVKERTNLKKSVQDSPQISNGEPISSRSKGKAVVSGAAGSKYTWWIKRDGQEFIRERLDGAVVNEAWCDIFPYTQVVNLPRIHSNHHPLLVKRSNISPDRQASKNFRFENAWLSHPSFADFIKQN